jgi:hypothetical protein
MNNIETQLTIMSIDQRLIRITERLQEAVKVCCEADSAPIDSNESYPYAVGWSRSAMNAAVDNLTRIVKEYQSITLSN